MEENEVEQKETRPKEDLKLGRLQYKIDYDFNSNNVSIVLAYLLTTINGQYFTFVKILKSFMATC